MKIGSTLEPRCMFEKDFIELMGKIELRVITQGLKELGESSCQAICKLF